MAKSKISAIVGAHRAARITKATIMNKTLAASAKEDKVHENLAYTYIERIFSTGDIEREFKFHPTRKWRFDIAIPRLLIAFEIEGGIWIGGRHIHPLGFEKDCEKYNEAQAMGWKVFRLTPKFIKEDYIKQLISTNIRYEENKNEIF